MALAKILITAGLSMASFGALARDIRDAGRSFPGSSLTQRERITDGSGNTRGYIDRDRTNGEGVLRDRNRNRVGTIEREQGRTVIRRDPR